MQHLLSKNSYLLPITKTLASLSLLVLLVIIVPGCDDDDDEVEVRNPAAAAFDTKLQSGERFFITDDQGRAVIYRGFNFEDEADSFTENFVLGQTDEDDFAHLQQMGMNLVRMPRFWNMLEPKEGQINQEYLDRTRELLDWAEKYDLKMVLSMHQDIYCTEFTGRGFPNWTLPDDLADFTLLDPWWLNYLNPAVIQAFTNFWDSADLQQKYIGMVMRYVNEFHDHPALLGYDLFNEPFHGEKDISTLEAGIMTDFYNETVAEIRTVDQTAWLFYQPVALTVNASVAGGSVGVINDEKAGYMPHFYQIEAFVDQPYVNQDPAAIAVWAARRIPEAAVSKAPLILGEFGAFPQEAGHQDYLANVLDMADRATAGWAYWTYKESWFVEENTQIWRELMALLNRPYARAIAGLPKDMSFDRETRIFEVTYHIREGVTAPTEIFVPEEEEYPNGWRARVATPTGDWEGSFDEDTNIYSVKVNGFPGDSVVITIEPKPMPTPVN